MKQKRLKCGGLLSAAGLLLAGCGTMTVRTERNLNRMADNAVAKIVLEQPGLQAELGAAVGYIAFEWRDTNVPMVGKNAEGVLIGQTDAERTPIRIIQLEMDGAHGAKGFSGVMVIHDAESFNRAKTEKLSLENAGTVYIYDEGKASAAYTVKRITMEPKVR